MKKVLFITIHATKTNVMLNWMGISLIKTKNAKNVIQLVKMAESAHKQPMRITI